MEIIDHTIITTTGITIMADMGIICTMGIMVAITTDMMVTAVPIITDIEIMAAMVNTKIITAPITMDIGREEVATKEEWVHQITDTAPVEVVDLVDMAVDSLVVTEEEEVVIADKEVAGDDRLSTNEDGSRVILILGCLHKS